MTKILTFSMCAVLAMSAGAQTMSFKQMTNPEGLSQGITLAQQSRADDPSIVREAPEGKHEVFARSGEGWFVPYYKAERVSFENYGAEMITTDDGTVYLKNPQSHLVSDSYIVGKRDNDTIRFQFPQTVYSGFSDWQQCDYVYYCVMLDYKAQSDTKGTYVQSDNQELVLVRNAQGAWVEQGPSDGGVLFGMVDQDGEWFGFGDWNLTFTPFDTKPLEAPQGLKTEKWAMKYSGTGHFVEVGIQDNEMWIKGLTPILPEAWIKGTITGQKVVFEGGQYMGMDIQDYYHNYFFGATQDQDVDPNTGKDVYVYRLAKEVRFDYDAASKTLKTDNYLDINADPEKEASHDVFYMPVIAWQPEVINLQPEKPAIFDYFTYNPKEGVGGILFDLNQYNVEGQLIDSHNMYYRVLVDEDVLEVDPADYQSTTEKMTDIPYWYTDYTDIFGRRVTHEFYFFVRDFDFMGMVAIYKDGAEEYISPIATCYGTAPACWDNLPKGWVAIDETNVAAQPVSHTYVNMQGAQVTEPQHGIFIRTTRYSDGTVKHDKVLK